MIHSRRTDRYIFNRIRRDNAVCYIRGGLDAIYSIEYVEIMLLDTFEEDWQLYIQSNTLR